MGLPNTIANESELIEVMTQPSEALVESISRVSGPLVVVGAGGKMGPSLCVLAKRAAEKAGRDLQVIALSRFSNAAEQSWLEERGVQTQRFDALAEPSPDSLPDASHVVYLVGLKFGTSQRPDLTWATNTIAPATVSRRYREVPMVALSTGNVYPMVPADSSGCAEDHPLTPLGEYANAAVARERVFEFFSAELGMPLCLLRLNYALDLRYGILVDLAQTLLAGEPVDLSMSRVNCIWQGEANERILRALELAESPAAIYNLTSNCIFDIRELATQVAGHLGVEATFKGQPAATALLSDASKLEARLGELKTPMDTVLRWTADWIRKGGRTLGRPTKFQVRDGAY